VREHVSLDQRQHLGRQQDRPRHRHLLHARRQVRRLPDRGVVHVEVAADRADDDLAGVEADADVHRHAERAMHALRVLADALLHAKRGVARSDRVLFVRDRRAEQRHDAVAHHLVDRALVVVHGFDHPLEHTVEQSARVLGVAVGEQLHRSLEVGEEHGDVLALALERVLRRADPLGQVRRGIGRRRCKARRSGRRGGRRRGALRTELRAGRKIAVAFGAARGQRRGALGAKFRSRRRLVLAAGTLHGPQ
jgi:hypothetical protein